MGARASPPTQPSQLHEYARCHSCFSQNPLESSEGPSSVGGVQITDHESGIQCTQVSLVNPEGSAPASRKGAYEEEVTETWQPRSPLLFAWRSLCGCCHTVQAREPVPGCRQLHQEAAAWHWMAAVARAGVSQRIFGGGRNMYLTLNPSLPVPFRGRSLASQREEGWRCCISYTPSGCSTGPHSLAWEVLRCMCSVYAFILQILADSYCVSATNDTAVDKTLCPCPPAAPT